MVAQAPAYTASLDAALTLVPEGYFGRVFFGGPNSRARSFCHAIVEEAEDGDEFEHNNASNPALALCIASLKARAYQERAKKGSVS